MVAKKLKRKDYLKYFVVLLSSPIVLPMDLIIIFLLLITWYDLLRKIMKLKKGLDTKQSCCCV